jgi:hypothetical protein
VSRFCGNSSGMHSSSHIIHAYRRRWRNNTKTLSMNVIPPVFLFWNRLIAITTSFFVISLTLTLIFKVRPLCRLVGFVVDLILSESVLSIF